MKKIGLFCLLLLIAISGCITVYEDGPGVETGEVETGGPLPLADTDETPSIEPAVFTFPEYETPYLTLDDVAEEGYLPIGGLDLFIQEIGHVKLYRSYYSNSVTHPRMINWSTTLCANEVSDTNCALVFNELVTQFREGAGAPEELEGPELGEITLAFTETDPEDLAIMEESLEDLLNDAPNLTGDFKIFLFFTRQDKAFFMIELIGMFESDQQAIEEVERHYEVVIGRITK